MLRGESKENWSVGRSDPSIISYVSLISEYVPSTTSSRLATVGMNDIRQCKAIQTQALRRFQKAEGLFLNDGPVVPVPELHAAIDQLHLCMADKCHYELFSARWTSRSTLSRPTVAMVSALSLVLVRGGMVGGKCHARYVLASQYFNADGLR